MNILGSPIALAAALAVSVVASACAATEVVVAEGPTADAGSDAAADGLGVARACASAAECTAGELCERSACGDAHGLCVPLPPPCVGAGDPVCGCDGVTYWNDCVRRERRVTSANPGPCGGGGAPAVSCVDAAACPNAGAACGHLAPPGGPCSGSVPGTCWQLPATCPAGPPPPGQGFVGCGVGGACFDLCEAVRSGLPRLPAPLGVCP